MHDVIKIASAMLKFLLYLINGLGLMKQKITGYHKDHEEHWVAQLVCGHFQHVRHNPPWTVRLWVTTKQGRNTMIGHQLNCVKCDNGAVKDQRE